MSEIAILGRGFESLLSALSVVVRTGSVMGTQPKNLPVER